MTEGRGARGGRTAFPFGLSWVLLPYALSAGLTIGSAGCEGADAQERIVLGPGDLPASAGVQPGADAWQSVAWGGDRWQPYPGEATVQFSHDLGRMPVSVLVYVAFDEAGRGAALAAGDLAHMVEVTETTVTIRNDTEADLFCRLTLH